MAYVGIDLGTTFSAVAYLNPQGVPTTIPNAEGDLTTPSVVLFEKSGEIVVGREARRAALVEPGRVADCVKRSMGEPYYSKLINGQKISPIEISSKILEKLKSDAEARVGPVQGAVITVPAYFDEGRRQATAEAGKMAGLKVLDIVNEPTAAALAYAFEGFGSGGGKSAMDIADELAKLPPRIAVVYDLGGGTFDVTVIRIDGTNIVVLATAGDVRLGGREWDERLVDHMANQFIKEFQSDPRKDPVSAQNLLMAAEECKKILSSRRQTHFAINHAGRTCTGEITREAFEEMTADLLFRSESRLNRVVKQAHLTWDRVAEILPVGGSTRMPQVLNMLRRVAGKAPNQTLSPDEAVAHGAALHAAICVVNGAAEVSNFKAPDLRGGAAGKEEAQGSALLGMFFKDDVTDLLKAIHTTNVNSHSLGVIVTNPQKEERVSVLIPHNTALPVEVLKRFVTVSQNQKHVTVRVVEGESHNAAECIPVGSCRIQELPLGLPKGSPIDVKFSYDNSGRLHVEAVEPSSGRRANVAIHRKMASAQARQTETAGTSGSTPGTI
jgi:molecular chaperone DnaK